MNLDQRKREKWESVEIALPPLVNELRAKLILVSKEEECAVLYKNMGRIL